MLTLLYIFFKEILQSTNYGKTAHFLQCIEPSPPRGNCSRIGGVAATAFVVMELVWPVADADTVLQAGRSNRSLAEQRHIPPPQSSLCKLVPKVWGRGSEVGLAGFFRSG